jgi:uncharacterized phiE125 gp8 family phage protein
MRKYQLAKTSNPTTLPVSLADAKLHLNIESSETYFDDELTSLIYTARDLVERRTHLTLIATTYTAKWMCFPKCELAIPGYPISAIDSVQYYDTDGTLQTLASHQESLSSKPVFISPDVSDDWPDTQDERIDAVQVSFTAGYGATSATVPYQCAHLIKLLVGHWFKNREAVGTTNGQIELGFTALVNSVQVNEFQEFSSQ